MSLARAATSLPCRGASWLHLYGCLVLSLKHAEVCPCSSKPPNLVRARQSLQWKRKQQCGLSRGGRRLSHPGPSLPPSSTCVRAVQAYVEAEGDCEERGISRLPAHEVHKIAVLDMRLGNCDRNGGPPLRCALIPLAACLVLSTASDTEC